MVSSERRRLVLADHGGKAEGEYGALSRNARCRDVAPQSARQPTTDRESQTRAPIFPIDRRIGLGEILEYVLDHVGRDADARIRNDENDFLALVGQLTRDRQRDGSILGKLAGVRNQGNEDLPDPRQGRVHAPDLSDLTQ